MKATILILLTTPPCFAQDIPDIRTVPADLTIPKLEEGPPAPGKRVREVLPEWKNTDVYHIVYLPRDFDPKKQYPVIVEFAGNGGFTSKWGDVSTGLPDGSKLGYGMSGGKEFIWICTPYLNADGKKIATRWWGDKPKFDPKPTVSYCKKLVPFICEKYSGDPKRVVIAGFSRGAIAVNYIGLHDDEIAKLWCGFVAYSHYDGAKLWGYPASDRKSAHVRLQRLKGRPQFICHEGGTKSWGLTSAKECIDESKVKGMFTFVPTSFRNHADAWTLRPSPAREKLRKWLLEATRPTAKRSSPNADTPAVP